MKTNRNAFEHAPGLRLGLYPEERRGQRPELERGLIKCPLPYSGPFMELFGASFQIVAQIVAARGKLPSRAALVYDDDMAVAKWLVDRAAHPLVDILAALEPLKQPQFLDEALSTEVAREFATSDASNTADTEATAPIPQIRT